MLKRTLLELVAEAEEPWDFGVKNLLKRLGVIDGSFLCFDCPGLGGEEGGRDDS